MTKAISILHACLISLQKYHKVFLLHYQDQIVSGAQLLHSEYLQHLLALFIGLNFHTVFLFPPKPPHLPRKATPQDWKWLFDLSMSINMAESLSRRTSFSQGCLESLPRNISTSTITNKYQPIVSICCLCIGS